LVDFCIQFIVNLFEMVSISGLRSRQTPNSSGARTSFFIALTSVIAVSIAGCSKSKEDAALERIANRKPPAYVRYVNFANTPLTLKVKGGASFRDVAAGSASLFTISPSGPRTISVQSAGKSIFNSDLSVDPGKATSVVTTEKGTKIYDQEQRDAKPGQSAVRAILMSDGSSVSVESDAGPLIDKLGPESASETKDIPSGHHTFKVKTADGKVTSIEGDLAAADVYTIFIDADKTGVKLIFEHNSPLRKPITQGSMAGAG